MKAPHKPILEESSGIEAHIRLPAILDEGRENQPFLTRLHLLGTVHHDPVGFGKLTRFLQAFQPDLILVELSPFGLQYRKAHQISQQRDITQHLRALAREKAMPLGAMEKHPEILALRRQVAIPFEFRASLKYAQTFGVPLILTDSSTFSQEMIQTWNELISCGNLSLLLESVGRQNRSITNRYSQARHMIQRDKETCNQAENHSFSLSQDTGEEVFWAERERQMADAIQGALRTHTPRQPLHIGGWWHLTLNARVPTLRQLLNIDEMRCHLLDD